MKTNITITTTELNALMGDNFMVPPEGSAAKVAACIACGALDQLSNELAASSHQAEAADDRGLARSLTRLSGRARTLASLLNRLASDADDDPQAMNSENVG